MYVAPSSVNACYAFDIDKIGSMAFAISRCMRVPKIVNFGQSVLKIPAKNYVGLINFGPPGRQTTTTTANYKCIVNVYESEPVDVNVLLEGLQGQVRH